MRVSFNDVQGRTFLISSTKSASVDLPDLAAGVYDIVLYDYSQEVARLPKALTILPLGGSPTVDVDVSGAFLGLPDAIVAELKPGVKLPPTGEPQAEIVSVGAVGAGSIRVRAGAAILAIPSESKELPATLRVRCSLAPTLNGPFGCNVSGPVQPAAVMPDSVLTLPGPHGYVNFQIADVHLASASPISQARVRFVASQELLALMKAGDRDNAAAAGGPSRQATISSIGASRAVSSAEAGLHAPIGGGARLSDVVLQVPVDGSRGEWTYKGDPLKVGAPFTFETPRYVVRGEVIGMTAPAASSAAVAGR